MSENTSTLLKTIWFLLSRLMILTGMVLFFSSLSFVLGSYLAKICFGVDAISDPTVFSTFDQNPAALNALKLLQVTITLGGMIIPAWLFPKAIEQEPGKFLGITTPVSFQYFALAITLILLSIPFVSWLIEINAQLRLPQSLAALESALKASEEAAAALTKAFIASDTTQTFLINILIVAIFPAIAEELLFRGALQSFLILCFKNIHVAVVLGAAIFSAFHGQVYGFLPRWVLGMILGYLFASSRSIWPGVFAHFVNNVLTLIVTHFALEKSSLAFLHDDYHFPIFVVLGSVIACLAVLYYMYFHQKQNLSTDGEQLD
jgi:uncharacterized protein